MTPSIGQRFDTPYERGCIAVSAPDLVGNFDAYDSDGVLCSFSPAMVTRVYGPPIPERCKAHDRLHDCPAEVSL